jgi:DNA-binding HxlR family transcriptional regulator
MSVRTYGQNCGVARALDVLGERWTLLIVRELLLGPRRYRDLLDALAGIGTNLLAARLKALEAQGIVRRATPGGAAGYELTADGEALEPVMAAMALWGYGRIPREVNEDRSRASWVALSMRATLEVERGTAPDGLYALEVGDERIWVRIADNRATVRLGPPPYAPDLVLRCDLPTFLRLAEDGPGPQDAGRTDDPDRLAALLRGFRLPRRPVRAGSAELAGAQGAG